MPGFWLLRKGPSKGHYARAFARHRVRGYLVRQHTDSWLRITVCASRGWGAGSSVGEIGSKKGTRGGIKKVERYHGGQETHSLCEFLCI